MAQPPELTAHLLSDSAAQAKRVLGGRSFEGIVMYILNVFLKPDGIAVVPGNRKGLSEVIDDEMNVEQIISYTRLPVKRRCTQTQLEDYPDSDLFAIIRPHHPANAWRLLAILNCKVNFHSRETEATFWGLSVRNSCYVKYVCVTEDSDSHKVRSPRSELGTSCEHSTKARRLLESYTDRVYICKHYTGVGDSKLGNDVERMLHRLDADGRSAGMGPFFDDPGHPKHTEYCYLVRPIDDLIDDLRQWKAEVPAAE